MFVGRWVLLYGGAGLFAVPGAAAAEGGRCDGGESLAMWPAHSLSSTAPAASYMELGFVERPQSDLVCESR